MKNYFVALLSPALLLTVTMAIPNVARAEAGSVAAAQPHIDKAKEAAWRPKDGLFDMTKLYEAVCAPALNPKGPVEPPEPTPSKQRAASRWCGRAPRS